MGFKRLSVSALIVALALANVALGAPVPHHISGASHGSHLASSAQSLSSAHDHEVRSLRLVARDQDTNNTKETGAAATKQADGQAINQDNKKESGLNQNAHSDQQNENPQDTKLSGADPKEGHAAKGNLNAKAADKNNIEPKVGQPNTDQDHGEGSESKPDSKVQAQATEQHGEGQKEPTLLNTIKPAEEHSATGKKEAPPTPENQPGPDPKTVPSPPQKSNPETKGTQPASPENKQVADAKATPESPESKANPEAKAAPPTPENKPSIDSKSNSAAPEAKTNSDPKSNPLQAAQSSKTSNPDTKAASSADHLQNLDPKLV